MDDDEWFEQLYAEQRKEKAARLAAAKEDAAARGKERFDLARFEELYVTYPDHLEPPPEEVRLAEWEERYYVRYPDVMTVEELAAIFNEMAPYL